MDIRSLLFSILVLFCFSCTEKEEELNELTISKLEQISIPKHFPAINFPKENDFSTERWVLGKKLFFDKRLSEDGSISCASCHKQAFAFSDNVDFTDGVYGRKGVRNSPSLVNVAYHPYYTREGGIPSLEMQVLVPVSEHNEFGFNLVLITDRLSSDISYQEMAMKAYGRSLDAYTITRAISNYERSIISGGSRYDEYVMGNSSILTEDELKGKELFFSDKTNCSKCHGGFNFTDYGFKNNGLYDQYKDTGRYRLTNKEEDLAIFKTPSLRNIGFTAPYMHDGSIQTLKGVIEHYNSGGKPHKNKSNLIKPLGLSDKDKEALLKFLYTLDDNALVSNPIFSE